MDKEQMDKERMDKERIDKEQIVRMKCIVCNKSELCISMVCQKCSPACWWCDNKYIGPQMCSCVNFCNLTPEERANKHKNHIKDVTA
jgi:hypothetical protein